MFKKTVLVVMTAMWAMGCQSKKEFVITDEQVATESTLKKDKSGKPIYSTTLTDNDKQYFAKKLAVTEPQIYNVKLYNFIKAWEGTPYIYGGTTRNGIDCSALMRELYSYVYGKNLSGTASDIAMDKKIELFKQTENLREGDLVFFRITDEKIITHVGIYLQNDRFFSANRYGGTEISSLQKPYWEKNFITAGRFAQ
ncbi:NlpC/P60 family protein [Flavobacterium zepuense]|uniref:NlpC/P60 family protein n=1 Tax=Flavobacterium zepuense TaxID=2593302 RepID=A0A552V5C5_9FLAO|nr:C40 family peptidase [Flavobacterium zepuense]TRW25674.1 NlpC/P60 family protein [Flavobacterium zepuense]